MLLCKLAHGEKKNCQLKVTTKILWNGSMCNESVKVYTIYCYNCLVYWKYLIENILRNVICLKTNKSILKICVEMIWDIGW